MPVRTHAIALASVAALTAGGCTVPFIHHNEPAPAPLAAAPLPPVMQAPLPPPPGSPGAAMLPPPGGTQMAAVPPGAVASPMAPAMPAESNVEVGRTDLLGGWTLASGGDSCQLFMSLTTWSGGYRATTKGCKTTPLQGISAWNLEGKQVMLLNDTGTTVARLSPSSKTQYNGLTAGGGPVTVSR